VSDNLLERLRSAANSNELRHEAADEIERLSAQLASAREDLASCQESWLRERAPALTIG
jgi:chromosome segregation ATPase